MGKRDASISDKGKTTEDVGDDLKASISNMGTLADAAQGQNKKPAANLPSKFVVAVPRIPDLRRNALLISSSSGQSKAETKPSIPPLSTFQDVKEDKQAKSHTQYEEVEDEIGEEKERGRVGWEYDVYAEPFIPSALRSVNEDSAIVVTTDCKHEIDSLAYIETFLGRSFVPDRSNIPIQHTYQQPSLPMNLTEDSYFQYFQTLLEAENVAKELEYKQYTLYEKPLHLILRPGAFPTWSGEIYALSIPGLREDSPRVEMGDVLQLRQLCLNSFGNLMTIPIPMENSNFNSHFRLSWGGTQYNASVYGINRAREVVYLKITGFTPSYLMFMSDGNTPKPTFNVVFPLRERDLKSQWSALGYVASELKAASPSSNSPRSAHEELSCWAANIIVTASFSAQQANGTDQILEKEEQAPNDWIRRMLFPTEADGVVQMKLRTIPFRRGLFDHNMNYEQLQVVNSVCENEYGVLPFLISGPPGTGKTKTLVELALNLLNSTEIGHILICAPSDSAADTLVQRLKQHLTPNQLLRFNGPTRGDNEVPQGLLSYCYMKSEMFDLPPFAEFMAYNVVVTSTRDSSILADARLTNTDLFIVETRIRSAFHPESKHATPTLHWGALLIDEAAQATEVDALPALSVVMPPSTYPKSMPQPRLVMAGDQNQLGPKTASRNPEYSTSLFERLFNRPIYKNHPLSRSHARPSASPPVMTAKMLPMLRPPFTNLNRNYRSHPAILSVPSSLFYNDTLIPEATMSPSPLQTSPLWLGRKWPVLYIAHTGPDEIERDGGGWYNVSEAQRACNLAARLVTESGVKQTDICIMSPFSAQVRILRRMMRSHVYGDGAGMRDVNIGPVEAFQGLESRVVIICTTRTRDRFLDQDTKRGLGIVHQKRKINVALTRAKEALFVIGSPEVLGRDEHWRAFLAFCWRNGLVSKGGVVWDGSKDAHAESKIGVLERALLVKAEREEQGRENERVLGAGHAPRGLGVREDESWAEMLRAALEEFTDEEDAQDNDHDENEEGGYDDDDDDDKSMDDIAGSNSDSNGDDGVIQFVGKISGKKLTLRDGSSFAL